MTCIHSILSTVTVYRQRFVGRVLCVLIISLLGGCNRQTDSQAPTAPLDSTLVIESTMVVAAAESAPTAPSAAIAVDVTTLLTQTVPTAAPILVPTATPDPDTTPVDTATTAPEGTAPEGTAPEGTAPAGTITADLVNVRGGPGTNFPVVGEARRGQTVNIVARTAGDDWMRVCCLTTEPAVETWILAELLTTSGDLTAVQVESGPEPPAVAIGGAVAADTAGLAAAPAPGLPGQGAFGPPGGVNPFTGQALPGDRAGRRPVIVCFNNDFAARPQFGTSQADVMYEYLMEGFGITRFSGLFYGQDVAQIGPIRSARLINYYLGALYGAGLACSGASDQVRYTLKHEAPFPYMDIDLDDPSNARYSVSIGSDYRTRLRTDTGRLMRWLNEWSVQQPAAVRGFTFGGLPPGGAPGTTISIPYPAGTGSNVDYRYDGGSGRYLRSLGSVPHLDGNSGAQIGVENVIVQYVPHEVTDIVEDSLGSLSIRLNLFGSGRALLLRDGQVFDGTWRSESRGDLPRFYAADGSELALKPGHTWISVVPVDYTVRVE